MQLRTIRRFIIKLGDALMSMFKVGDKVVRLDLDSPHIYSIMRIEDGLFTIGRKVKHRTWGTWLECSEIRLASPEEIAAGHRIDHAVDVNEMGDDTHIENPVSPLCKVVGEVMRSEFDELKRFAISDILSVSGKQKTTETINKHFNAIIDIAFLKGQQASQSKVDELQRRNQMLNDSIKEQGQKLVYQNEVIETQAEKLLGLRDEKAELQTEVTRLNSTVERLKAENVAMQVELDKSRNQAYKHLESCENSLNSQTERFDELSEKVFKVFEIINNPDNHYCPFGWVAEQIQAVLGEVQGEVS